MSTTTLKKKSTQSQESLSLQQRLQKLKSTAPPISFRALSVNEFGELVDVKADLDKRIVKGYLVIWGVRNLYGEKFVKGCFAKSIREHGPGTNSAYQIKFLNQHRQDQACALFSVLKEDDTGLYFETAPLDPVEWADNLLIQLNSGTINNFSIGWDWVWDKIEWDDEDESLVIIEGILFEGSAVSIPADMNTFRVRSAEDVAVIHDEIEDFINTLPRKDRIQARKLFALQKSLIDLEPLIDKNKTALKERDKPTEKGKINLRYIINNL
jgi:uncharacterized protein